MLYSMESRVGELVALVVICSGVCNVVWTVGLESWWLWWWSVVVCVM